MKGMLRGTEVNYSFLQERLDAVIPQIPSDYVDELNGFADAITDSKSAFVAENCVSGGKAGIRTVQSKLVDGLKWDNPDSLCVVNGYALEGNFDNLTSIPHNTIRWQKFNERLMKYDKVNAAFTQPTGEFPKKPVFVKVR